MMRRDETRLERLERIKKANGELVVLLGAITECLQRMLTLLSTKEHPEAEETKQGTRQETLVVDSMTRAIEIWNQQFFKEKEESTNDPLSTR